MKRRELKECVEFLGQDGSLDAEQRWALWTELRPVSAPIIGKNEKMLWSKLKEKLFSLIYTLLTCLYKDMSIMFSLNI